MWIQHRIVQPLRRFICFFCCLPHVLHCLQSPYTAYYSIPLTVSDLMCLPRDRVARYGRMRMIELKWQKVTS